MASQGSLGQKVPDEQMGLSQEKLIEKYKSALNIAQKAKNARDEALKSCKLLQNENEQLKEKVSSVENQYKTAEEMLAALTDQKLKLAMEIDDLKKEKRIYFEELKSKKNLESEFENYRSEYKKVLKENENLISSLEETISNMKKEHEELKKRNGTLKQVCNNIQIEKSELEKNLNASNKKLSHFEENQNILNSILAKKYNTVVDEFRHWAEIIDSGEDSFAKLQLLEMENEALKSEKDKLNISNQSLTKDKESMELEMVELNDRIKKICLELDEANADRDKMLNNLEKVSLETKRLIENSEVLTQELSVLKEERASMEHLINVLNNEKQSFLKIIAEKELDLDRLASELKGLEDKKSIAQDSNLRNIEDNNTENINQTNEGMSEDSSEKERSVNVELISLQNDLKAFSAEIESYKEMVKESEAKLEEALGSISEKEEMLKSQGQLITELKSKVDQMECMQAAVANSLLGTREQLVTALQQLEDVERLKEDLQHECLLKDEEFLVACHKLQVKEHFIKEIIDGMEGLRLELNNIHKINVLEEEFDTENSQPEDYIRGLKKCMDAITCKMYHNYKKEIESLREIINEYQENNEALAIDNNKLSKQAKELLNEQANFDSGLVIKLKTFKENLLHQLKEKQSVIANLEKEISSLKDQLAEKDNTNEKIAADKNDLKCSYDKMVSETSLEIKSLSEKLRDLEERHRESVSSSGASIDLINNLRIEIKELKDFIGSLENQVGESKARNSHLNDAIISLSSLLEKENKEFKNLLSVMNSTLLEDIKEVSTSGDDINKGFNEIEFHRSLMTCLVKELDRIKERETLAKEDNRKIISLSEENNNLSQEITMITRKAEELQSSISNLETAFNLLIELCTKNKFSSGSNELEKITELLPTHMKEILDNLKILGNIQSDLESNANKIANLESLLKEKEAYIETELGKKDSIIGNLKEQNNNLSEEVTTMTRKAEELESSISNLETAFTLVIDFCTKNKFSSGSNELEKIIKLLPDHMKGISDNLKILGTIHSDLESNANKIANLESLLKEKEAYIETELGKKDSIIGNLKEQNNNLSEEVTTMTRKAEELESSISNLEKALTLVIEFCKENKFSSGSNELEKITELLPNHMKGISDNLKILGTIHSDLESNAKKIANLESLLKEKEAYIETERGKNDCIISNLKEENTKLSEEITMMIKKTEGMQSCISNLEKALNVFIELCLKNKFHIGSNELDQIIELLPNHLKGMSNNLKLLDNVQSDLEINATKIVDLESSLKEKDSYIETELRKKDSMINDLKEEIKILKDKVDNLSGLNYSLNSDLSSFKENLERLRSEYNSEKDILLDKNNKIQNELKDCKELLDFKSLELRENNRIWAGRFSSLKVALIGLNKTRKEIRNQFESVESSFNSFLNGIQEPLQEKVDLVVQNAVAASKAELIREMHQMNQALKERGEMISKLEFTITDCHTKMKQLTSVSENLQSELVQVKTELRREEDAVKDKDQLIKQLEAEIEQLKENHESTAPDNDVLSTSTISRTEEHSRLKDVEDSFEDRYTKLKLIAVKLKKRAADLSHTLDSERAKFTAEKADLQEKMASMSMAVKNAQKIQELFDESLDERDKLKKDNEQLKNTVEELKKNELSLNNKISTLESSNQNIPIMKKHIDSLNGNIKESKSEIQRLQMEVKAEAIKYEEMKKTANKLEATVQELTNQLEQAKQQGKNNNVLELEMKNYEKIIADLSSQLNIERSTIKSLKSENEALSNVKVGLHEQISILEKQIAVEQQRIQDAQDQIAVFQTRLEEKNIQIETLNSSIGELKKHLSEEKSKNEALTVEMSSVTSDYSKKELAMLSKISSSQDEIRSLETSLQSTKQELATAKREIDHLNEEYESYKLRAQTILAKKKGDLVTHAEKEAKEECDRLKRECTGLEERLDSAMSEIDTLNTRISSLNLEKARSEKKYEEMRAALQQKLVEHDVLSTEMYNLKMANEVAIEQLKAELTKRKNEYQAELSHHKKIIDDLMLEFKQKEEENVHKDKVDNNVYSLSNFPESILPSSEREDGEGSESVPSPKTRRHSGVVPLDVLLNSPDESKVNVLQEQVEKLQKDLGRSEVRARHLSSLLSEAEKDSARNLHQNKVLKEELRRLERALERQPHVANTEYLKNVIFKFVTLPNGDERSRLVPVLDTLLKFSPEETHKLCSVAKGEAQAGWGSYLQSWTGL